MLPQKNFTDEVNELFTMDPVLLSELLTIQFSDLALALEELVWRKTSVKDTFRLHRFRGFFIFYFILHEAYLMFLL